MKRCPECRRDYYDDPLSFCLDDGARLFEGPASIDEPATALIHPADLSGDVLTKPQLHTTDQTALHSIVNLFIYNS